MPVMPILSGGLTPVSRWYVTRRLVAPGVSNVTGGPVLARVLSDSNGYSMRHGLRADRWLDLVWIYETLYSLILIYG